MSTVWCPFLEVDARHNHFGDQALPDVFSIVSTREPESTPGPEFALVRGADSCAWAIGSCVGDEQAREIARLAFDEHPTSDFRKPPKHMDGYMEIIGGEWVSEPAFEFPDRMRLVGKAVLIEDVEPFLKSFNGWTADELPGRSPIMAIVEVGVPVSVCFCARVSEFVAEAGVETGPEYRGRGLARSATIAWVEAIRASTRTPMYSTSWSNGPSLVVDHKLGLVACASYWNLLLRWINGPRDARRISSLAASPSHFYNVAPHRKAFPKLGTKLESCFKNC